MSQRQGYAAVNDAQPQPQPSPITNTIVAICRMLVLYYIVSAVIGYINRKPVALHDHSISSINNNHHQQLAQQSIQRMYRPLWHDNTPFSMYVYINDVPHIHSINTAYKEYTDTLVYHSNDFTYNWNVNNTREFNLTINDESFNNANLLSTLQSNRSIYCHVYVINHQYLAQLNNNVNINELIRLNKYVDDTSVIYFTYRLNSYRAAPKIKTKKNLFGDDTDLVGLDTPSDHQHKQLSVHTENNDKAMVNIINYWKPILSIRYVHDFTEYRRADITADWSPYIQLDDTTLTYKPIYYIDEFWLLSTHYTPINHTVTELPLHISISPISLIKFRLQLQLDQSWRLQQSYGQTESDTDQIKRIFIESNPYFLALTMCVSLLHSLFDFLAFKNDIQFWKSNTAGVGLSRGSIVVNTICQLIIFLYLCDNDTSYVILVSQFIGLVIEVWKISRSCDVTRISIFPYISIKIKNLGDETIDAVDNEQQQLRDTARYDAEAMRYLSYALFPLVLVYSIYTLIYEKHVSLYSWILSSLVGAVYCFGFILMCPQLYLNYKLKSVAHMPWRQMSYKFLNTIIDDLFAFVISMPILHRISVFRDDLIFCLFLYQRWIYRVDYTRTNEFGLQLTDEQRIKLEEEQNKKYDTNNTSTIQNNHTDDNVLSNDSSESSDVNDNDEDSINENALRQRKSTTATIEQGLATSVQ